MKKSKAKVSFTLKWDAEGRAVLTPPQHLKAFFRCVRNNYTDDALHHAKHTVKNLRADKSVLHGDVVILEKRIVKAERDRDNWRRRAGALRDIIKRGYQARYSREPGAVFGILKEAVGLDKEAI